MKPKHLIIIIPIIAILVVGYWLVSPLWRTTRVDEALPSAPTAEPVVTPIKTGTFTGFDRLHNGSGTASLIQVDGAYFIRFESDFSVTNGPDLYVGFGNDGVYARGSEVGKLKGTAGSQNYALPAGFDPERYNEIWVWCKAFGVGFARAVVR